MQIKQDIKIINLLIIITIKIILNQTRKKIIGEIGTINI